MTGLTLRPKGRWILPVPCGGPSLGPIWVTFEESLVPQSSKFEPQPLQGGAPLREVGQIFEPWRAPGPNLRTLAPSRPKSSNPSALQAQIFEPWRPLGPNP